MEFQPARFADPKIIKPAFIPEEDFDDAAGKKISPARVFLFVGTFMLTMLCMIPVWNAAALLQDPMFVHMIGDSIPVTLICCCLGIIACYFVVVSLFFAVSSAASQTEQTILLIGSLFLTALGVTLLLLSSPLAHYSQIAYNDLWNNCQFGTQTRSLTDASQALQGLRASAQCKSLHSIEQCAGFTPSATTEVLKAMEFNFKCSGFCYKPVAGVSETNSSKVAAVKSTRLMEVDSTPLLQLAQAAGLDASAVGDSLVDHISFTPYPPTLFSTANFQASCDSMAARNMKNFSGDVALQTFYEGVGLVLTAIVLGFLKLASYFGPRDFEERSRLKHLRDPTNAYGATTYPFGPQYVHG